MKRKATGSFSADREGSERLRAVMGATAVAILTIDRSSRIVDVNPATETMFGHPAGDLLGRDVGMLLPAPPRRKSRSFLKRYLDPGDPGPFADRREFTARRRDGTTFPVELSIDEMNHDGLCVVVIRDISERRALEQDVVNSAEEERIAVARELHDGVGSLLTAIKFRTEAFAKTLRAAAVPNADEIDLIVELVQDAIAQVRAISRGLHPIGAHPEDLLAAMRALAVRADRGPEFQCRLHCESPLSIRDQTVANHFFRIAQEAVSNALKHSGGSRIDITLDETADALVLTVSDNGGGIPREITESDGLGLLTMRYRANAINATLTIEPQHPAGTLVTCILPRGGPDAGGTAPAAGKRARA